MNQTFQIGTGKEDITPEADGYIVGGLYPRKTSFIKDPLFSKAMVIQNGSEKVAIIALDVILIYAEDALAISKKIEASTGIKAEHVFLCASHTHSGPYTIESELKLSASYLERNHIQSDIVQKYEAYMQRLSESVVRSAVQANENLEDCTLGTAIKAVTDVSQNRRVLKDGHDCWNEWLLTREEGAKWPKEGPIDPDLFVMAAVKADGKVKAVLYNFAVHACNNPTLESVSADFPGAVDQIVTQELGSDVLTLYISGASGNINPIATSDELGTRLGEEIIDCVSSLSICSQAELRVITKEISLQIREDTTFKMEEITRKWPDGLDFFSHSNQMLQQVKRSSYNTKISGFQLGDVAFVTYPVELFVEFGLEIKKHSPFEHTVIATITNGYLGYVPTVRAFDHGGYETFNSTNSFLSTQAGHEMVSYSLTVLNQLHGQGKEIINEA